MIFTSIGYAHVDRQVDSERLKSLRDRDPDFERVAGTPRFVR
jgi:hypothetical protein